MAVADRAGFPIAIYIDSASPHEIKLVGETLAEVFTKQLTKRLIGDKAYDSDSLNVELMEKGVELIVLHKCNRKKATTQDGRKLRRYKRRWKVERLFAWLHKFRRVVVRYDYHAENFLGFVRLACIKILLRCYL